MKKWEYYYERNLNSTRANELGSEGWELVSVALVDPPSGVLFFFKRELKKARKTKKDGK